MVLVAGRGAEGQKVRNGREADIDGFGAILHRCCMKAYLLISLMFLGDVAVAAQSISRIEAERRIAALHASHIEANVPDESEFSRFLERDLNAYFASRGVSDPAIQFELLRQGPTQSGIAYPKFYLWVQVSSGRDQLTAGAVRVAAVQREHFQITDWLTAEEIRADPHRLGSIFPAALVDAIRERAGLGTS